MTLILVLGNHDQFIQISDRRFSFKNEPPLDESNKVGTFICDDAYFLFGFTGLGAKGREGFSPLNPSQFITMEWILRTIAYCGQADPNASGIFTRFKLAITQEFQTNSWIKNLSKDQKRLSIWFHGYINTESGPIRAIYTITNFEDIPNQITHPIAWDEFKSFSKFDFLDGLIYIKAIGVSNVVTDIDRAILFKYLIERKSAKEIIDKGIEMLRAMADRPKSGNTIGKQLSSIRLSPDFNFESYYHTNVGTQKIFTPSTVWVQPPNIGCALEGLIKPVNPKETSLMGVRPVGRNKPCPCKSGKRYKNCHGQ